MTPEPRRLDSWKDIARHLGRDVTTAIRWEKERGLPIHRVPGGKLSRVFAYTNELDDWLRRIDEPAGRDVRRPLPEGVPVAVAPSSTTSIKNSPLVVAAIALIALAAGAVALASFRPAEAASLAVAGNALVGRDAAGRVVWSHPFEAARAEAGSRVWSLMTDLDNDRRLDSLAVVELISNSNTPIARLHRFSARGHLVWTYAPDDRVSFRAGEYGPPWASWHVETYRAGPEPRIAWSVHHFTWWPSLLISLTPNGERTGTFVNSGWISRASGTPDGRHLVVTGMSNAHRAYFLAILDAASPSGSSPESDGSNTQCTSCPQGKPLHYYVFPRSDVGEQFPYPGAPPDVTVLADGSVRVQVMETPGPNIGATVYELDAGFQLRDVRTTDAFDEWHRQLEASGALTHTDSECPARRTRDVRHWTPARSWHTIRVAPGG